MNSRIARRIINSLFVFFFGILPFAKLAQTEENMVHIGVVASLTGDLSFFGKGWSDSIAMAVEQINQRSDGTKYELHLEDDGSSASGSVSAFHKLTSDKRVQIIFSASSNIALSIAPLAKKRGIIHFAVASDSSFSDGVTNFNFWPAPQIPARALVEQFKKRSIAKISCIATEHAWPRAVFGALKEEASKAGIEIAVEQYFAPQESEFRPLIGRISRSRSDVVVLLAFPPQLEIFARQYKEMRVSTPITTDWSFETSTDPELFNGHWFVSFPTSSADYNAKFRARFGFNPYAQMEIGDLMVNALDAALRNGGETSQGLPIRVANGMNGLENLPSIFGPISFSKSGILELSYVLKIIKNGQAIPTENEI